MRRPILLAALVALAACASPTPTPKPACPTQGPTAVDAQATLADADRAVVDTNKGSFTIELYGDQAPLATANFVALARCGFYDGISFHRIIAGFVAQAGDPQTKQNHADFQGLGSGGPGYEFEIEPPADGLNYDPYVVAMANDTRTNGSQFFIDLADLNGRLQRLYTIFGKVIEETGVVDTIAKVPTNGPAGLPLDPVIINSIRIEAIPAPSPSL
ncbi:MAG: peptidylprolyl isomerase [Chloroflexota bacterium]|nr:peptidylprolyl isomerase [Chloroflexota bacterium]